MTQQATHSNTIELLRALVQKPSVTPDDQGCQALIAERLQASGFSIELMPFGDVSNLWARIGTQAPLLVFAGHTDVVPVGELKQWSSPPFAADIIDNELIGRGAADMKGSVAAMVTAAERFFQQNEFQGSFAFLLTSDEEGPAVNGTVKVIETLAKRSEIIDYCVVGEPTSKDVLGDTIKNGRRGSLGAKLSIRGVQGHVAYPHLADNPVHKSLAMLQTLTNTVWDNGNEHFPPTTLQISNIHAGSGAGNVIPGELRIDFNLRYSPESSIESIKTRVIKALEQHELDYEIQWLDSAAPFLTPIGSLTDAIKEVVANVTGIEAKMDTGGGTSDGRFIAKSCNQVIEFGPLNATIHQTDERINCEDIDKLSIIYEQLLQRLIGKQQ